MQKSGILNILLADDDPDDKFFFKHALGNLSYKVNLETVSDGVELLEYLKIQSVVPDVIFLDLNMPRMNGYEALKEIKSTDEVNNIPIVIYSTSYDPENARLLYQQGAVLYIKKTDADSLVSILSSLLSDFANDSFKRPEFDHFLLNPW